MRIRKYKRRYKKRKLRGRGLLGRDRRTWTPTYLSKKQKGGLLNLVAGAPFSVVPFLAKLLTKV